LYLNRLFPNSPLLEGLAVFYGGSMGHHLKWHLAKLDDYLYKHPAIDLNEPQSFLYMDNYTNPFGTIQGLLCSLAYKSGGLDKLKRLLSYEDLYQAVASEFGIKKYELGKFLRMQIHASKD
jgi:hypothetical protein